MEKPKGSNIEVLDNVRAPQALCPKCTTKLYLDMGLFMHDISKIVESKCPSCGANIYTGLLILVDSDIRHMGEMVLHISSLIAQGKTHWLGG